MNMTSKSIKSVRNNVSTFSVIILVTRRCGRKKKIHSESRLSATMSVCHSVIIKSMTLKTKKVKTKMR